MKLYFALIALLTMSISVLAQDTRFQQDYIKTDTSINQGKVVVLKKGKLIAYRQHLKANAVSYSPDQIKEFRTKDVVHEAIPLNGQTEFYQRVYQGNLTLLKGRDTYLVRKKDSTLVALTKRDFRSVIRDGFGSPGRDQTFSKLRFNNWSLSHYFRDVDAGRNNADAIAYRKFGVMAGYTFFHLNVGLYQTQLATTFSQVNPAFFFEFPVSRSLYIGPEVNFFSADVLPIKTSTQTQEFTNLKMSGYNVLGSLKWEFAHKRVRPYSKGGLFFSSTSIESPKGFIRASTNSGTVTLEQQAVTPGRKQTFGFHVGLGTQCTLHKRKTINIELKYMQSSRFTFKTLTMDYSSFAILTGITI